MSSLCQYVGTFFFKKKKNFIEFVACTIKKRKEKKMASATGAENRTMSQLIFNPNKY